MTDFSTGLNYTITVNGANINIDPTKQTLIAGRRTTGGDLITVPVGSSFSQPNLFIPFALPTFTDGVSAVNYLVNNYGFKVTWGVEFTQSLPAPTSVSSPQSDGSLIFTWATVPYGFTALTGINLTGTITQDTDTGTIVAGSVQIVGIQAQMRIKPTGLSTFNTTDSLVLNGTNNIQKPNPELSDEIVVGVFAFYNQATILPTGSTQPNAYISVLNDNCTTINPSSTPIVLGNPAAVTANSDGSQTLKYAITVDGLGYLPTTALGATTVVQALVTGTYNGYTLDGLGNIYINVKNTSGTFLTSASVTVTLDVTQSFFNYIYNSQLNFFVIPYQITQLTDLTTTQSTFYNGILTLNNGYGVDQQKFCPTGYYGNILPVGQLYSLQTPNSQYFKGAWKGDQPTAIDYPETAFSVACASAYMDANCNIPYYSQANVTLALSVSTNSTTYPSTIRGGDCNTVTQLGWTPIAVNSNGQAYCWRNVTSLTTIPNTSISDVEFRYVSVWQKQRWLQQQVWALWQQVSESTGLTNGGMVLNSPDVQQDFKTGCQSILYQGQSLGMFKNVDNYVSRVTVIQDPTLPTQFDVAIPNQVIPELATASVNAELFSIYYSFTS